MLIKVSVLLRGQVTTGFLENHQEDFCLALGISPSNPYEIEGGPSLKECAELIRRHAAFPILDLNKLEEAKEGESKEGRKKS